MTPRLKQILAFDAEYVAAHPSVRARACRERFGFGMLRLYQLRHRGLLDPAQIRECPVAAVGALQRRDEMRARRVAHLRVPDAPAAPEDR